MEETIQQPYTRQENQDLSEWFNNIVAQLRAHELMINEGVASKEVKQFYNDLIRADFDTHIKNQMSFGHKHMIGITLKELFGGLGDTVKKVEKIGLHLGNNKIRVWAVIPDDADELDKNLILTVAGVNAKIEQTGYFIDLYTVEKSENVDMPNQFKEVLIH